MSVHCRECKALLFSDVGENLLPFDPSSTFSLPWDPNHTPPNILISGQAASCAACSSKFADLSHDNGTLELLSGCVFWLDSKDKNTYKAAYTEVIKRFVYDVGGNGDCGPLSVGAALSLLCGTKHTGDSIRNTVSRGSPEGAEPGYWWTEKELAVAAEELGAQIYVWNPGYPDAMSFSVFTPTIKSIKFHENLPLRLFIIGGGPNNPHYRPLLASNDLTKTLSDLGFAARLVGPALDARPDNSSAAPTPALDATSDNSSAASTPALDARRDNSSAAPTPSLSGAPSAPNPNPAAAGGAAALAAPPAAGVPNPPPAGAVVPPVPPPNEKAGAKPPAPPAGAINKPVELHQLVKECLLKASGPIDFSPLRNIPTDANDPELAKQGVIHLSQFLRLNPEVFPETLVSQIATTTIIMGEEKSGKTALVAGVLGVILAYSEGRVATRCPTHYTVSHDPSIAPSEQGGPRDGVVITMTDPRTKQSETFESLFDAHKKATEIQQGIVGVGNGLRDTPSLVDTRSRRQLHALHALQTTDTPGLVGANAGQSFASGVEKICRHLFHTWVGPPTSTSWAVFVMRCQQQVRLQQWTNVLSGAHESALSRVAIVLTRIDELTADVVVNQLQSYGLPLSDEGLLSFFTTEIRNQIPKARVFLVANADTQNIHTEDDMTKAMANIDAEMSQAEGSRTSKFLKMLESLPSHHGYTRSPTAYNTLLAMTGIKVFRQFIEENSQQGTARLSEFVAQVVQKRMEAIRKELKEVKVEYAKIQKTGGKSEDFVRKILSSTNSLFYYLMTGTNIPTPSDMPANTDSDLLARDVWRKLLDSRTATLRQETLSSNFPSTMDDQTLELLYTTVDSMDAPYAHIQPRLNRVFLQFILRILLISPPKVTRTDVFKFMGKAPALQALSYDEFIEAEIQTFIKKQLADEASSHISDACRHIATHAVETTLMGIKLLPQWTMFTSNSSDSPEHIESMKLFCEDIKAFLTQAWVERLAGHVRFESQMAAAGVETPVVPFAPRLVGIAPVLLPRNKTYFENFMGHRGYLSTTVSNLGSILHKAVNALNLFYSSMEELAGIGNPTLAMASKLAKLGKKKLSKNEKPDAVPQTPVQTHDMRGWEYLETPEDRKVLIKMVGDIITTQDGTDIPHLPVKISELSDADMANVNHVLLIHIRTVILLYCFQVQLLLPKTHRAYTSAAFGTNNLTSEFYHYLKHRLESSASSEKTGESLQACTALSPADEELCDLNTPGEEREQDDSLPRFRGATKVPSLSLQETQKLLDKRYKFDAPLETLAKRHMGLREALEELSSLPTKLEKFKTVLSNTP